MATVQAMQSMILEAGLAVENVLRLEMARAAKYAAPEQMQTLIRELADCQTASAVLSGMAGRYGEQAPDA